MQLIRVECWTAEHEEDDEPLGMVVIAPDITEAEALCEATYRTQGFTKFRGEAVIDGLPGPTRVIGQDGQGSFSWRQ
jgi:hypothetical protein